MLCLIVLLTLTFVNSRGVRESGLAFVGPVLLSIGCLAVVIGIGLVRAWMSGGNPNPVIAPPALPNGNPYRVVGVVADVGLHNLLVDLATAGELALRRDGV